MLRKSDEGAAPVKATLKNRTRPVTTESIDKILGLALIDQHGPVGFFQVKVNYLSHNHPLGDVSINKMDFDSLFFILANYDRNRNSASREIQPDRDASEIDYLLFELAYATMLRVKDPEAKLSMNDLDRLGRAILDSKYLSTNDDMKDLAHIISDKLLELYRANQKSTHQGPR